MLGSTWIAILLGVIHRFELAAICRWARTRSVRKFDALDSAGNLNAHAERFVRTIKESCLERVILFGEGSVRKAAAEFTMHYHAERNHQGLNNQLICPDPTHVREEGR
jgi:hypothetical protein